MQTVLIVILVLVMLLFGLSSISQSYASAKQAQAAIDASRAVQIASAGNLVAWVVIALIVVVVLVIIILFILVSLRNKAYPQRRWGSAANTDWEYLPEQQANSMLPILATMLMVQLMQDQQQHHQETDQFFVMNELASDMSIFSDNTWDM